MKLAGTLVAAVAASTIAGSAVAADLPSPEARVATTPPPMLIDWTGFHVGLNAGGVFGQSSAFDVLNASAFINPPQLPAPIYSAISSIGGSGNFATGGSGGFLGGGQVGYNWQFGAAVAGLEADIQGIAGSSGSTSRANINPVPGFPPFPMTTVTTGSKRLSYLGTARARLGFLVIPSILAFVTGGIAYGGANALFAQNQAISSNAGGLSTFSYNLGGSTSALRAGWTIGGGAEWMFAPNWSLKLEYLYYDLGGVTVQGGVNGLVLAAGVLGAPGFWYANAAQGTSRFNGHIARAGVNYHFNWGSSAPVVARY
jgi:outer membrane immunogenic protein